LGYCAGGVPDIQEKDEGKMQKSKKGGKLEF